MHKTLNLIKRPRFVAFGANVDKLRAESDIPFVRNGKIIGILLKAEDIYDIIYTTLIGTYYNK